MSTPHRFPSVECRRTKAVNAVRKQEQRDFFRAWDDSPRTDTNYVWLFSDENRPAHHTATFAALYALHLKSRPRMGYPGGATHAVDVSAARSGRALLQVVEYLRGGYGVSERRSTNRRTSAPAKVSVTRFSSLLSEPGGSYAPVSARPQALRC